MQMTKKRRVFSDKFKAKVALDAVRGIKTLAQLAAEYQVHPNQISKWKQLLVSQAAELFSTQKSSATRTEEEITAPLYEEIGRLKMDVRWLEKNSEPAGCDTSKMGGAELELLHPAAVSSGRHLAQRLLLSADA
jgi:transposase